MSSFKILISRVSSKNQFWWEENCRGSFLTCAVADQSAEFGTEQNVDVIKDELYNNRLNTHFHESRGAAETRRLNLFRPATIEEQGMNATFLTQIASLQTILPKQSYLRRFGAHTIARFLQCMLVTAQYVPMRDKCLMRNSRVLETKNKNKDFIMY